MESDPTSRFTFKRTIGEGVYGDVQLAFDSQTGRHVAVKRMSKRSKYETGRAFNREVEAGRRLKYPGIVKVLDSLETPTEYWLVMEYIRGVDLVNWMESREYSVKESEIKVMFSQLLSSLKVIHDHGIAHRDIKLENILVDMFGHLSIIDFGLCCLEETDSCCGRVGSPEYCCPEIIDPDYGDYSGYAADAWSAGVTLYSMLNGRFPYSVDQLGSIADGDLIPLVWHNTSVSYCARALVEGLLHPDPELRTTIKMARHHRWFTAPDSGKMVGAPLVMAKRKSMPYPPEELKNSINLVGPIPIK